MTLLSIIIPAYNVANYINRCLDSIFEQGKMQEVEVICVNDGSKDNTLKLLCEYQTHEPRLKVIDQPNSGASAARNVGIERASGRWLMFVDADDYITNPFDSLISDAEAKNVDIAVTGIQRESRSGEMNITRLKNNFYNLESIYRIVLDTDTLSLGSPCCKILKTEIIKGNNIRFRHDLKLFEDAVFVYQYLEHCHSAMTSDIVFYCYDVKDVSTGGNYYGDEFSRCLREYVKVQESFVARFSNTPAQKKLLSDHHADSNSYNMLYAFYAIYRCENRPKNKYSALRYYLSDYHSIVGAVKYKNGLPKLFGKLTSIYPLL